MAKHNNQNGTDKINISLLVTYTDSPGKENTIHCTGLHRNCTQEQNEQPGIVGSGLCSIKRGGYPLVATELCEWLV